MKRTLTLFLTLFAALHVFAAGNLNDVTFIVFAPSAELKPASNGQYQLTLEHVTPYINYYTRRPTRTAGTTNMQTFFKAWTNGNPSFATSNPNVMVTATKVNGSFITANPSTVAILAKANYNPASEKFVCLLSPLAGQTFLFKNTDMEYVTLVIN